jgi:hypothetical protein
VGVWCAAGAFRYREAERELGRLPILIIARITIAAVSPCRVVPACIRGFRARLAQNGQSNTFTELASVVPVLIAL